MYALAQDFIKSIGSGGRVRVEAQSDCGVSAGANRKRGTQIRDHEHRDLHIKIITGASSKIRSVPSTGVHPWAAPLQRSRSVWVTVGRNPASNSEEGSSVNWVTAVYKVEQVPVPPV